MNNFEIKTDGRTVWVNGMHGCIGRFGRGGIDVHKTAAEQVESGTQCLLCTHGRPMLADWETFQAAMLKFYGTEIANTLMPGWVKGDT